MRAARTLLDQANNRRRMIMSSSRIAVATLWVGLACAAVLPSTAGATPAGDCAAAKRRATGKRVQGALTCWSLAAKKEMPVDPLCLARTEAQFLIAFARAERRAGCLTMADAAAIGAAADEYVASVIAALPASGAPVPTATETSAGPPATPIATGTAAAPLATPTATPTSTPIAKAVFATSTLQDGNLGGLEGADAICATRATAALLPGTFKAWLSTTTTSAASRLT